MRPALAVAPARQRSEQACRRCAYSSLFLDGRGLCPFCRGDEIERRAGLRRGVFRELVNLTLGEMEAGETSAGAAGAFSTVGAAKGRKEELV